MPTVPVRGLAEKGILHDPSPYELDLNAWSAGTNIRFHANKVERAPVFRTVIDTLVEEPTFVVGLEPSTGYDTVMVCGADGRVFQYGSGQLTEVSKPNLAAPVITVPGTLYVTAPAVTFSAAPSGGVTAVGVSHLTGGVVSSITYTTPGEGYLVAPTITIAAGPGTTAHATVALAYTPATDPRAWTSTFLGDVLYLNRPDQAPQYFGPQSTQFATLPNMETTWTCRSLRAFGDYMIALNVTKPATFTDPFTGLVQVGGAIPNMFKWSDLALDGQVPDSWDPDDPTKNTGENPLEELNTPIVDGMTLKSIFVIYSETQIWAAQQNGGSSIFNFYKLFDEGGMIAPNCAVEVDGIHYVLGTKDIYKHDGTTKVSIIDKRNKQFVFRNLNKQKSEVCFTAYLPQLDSILFAFNSGESSAKFPGVLCDRCNYGAMYDISADTWSFIDLPNVSGVTQANLDTVWTYSSAPSTLTYDNVGGSYYDQDNTFVKQMVSCSSTLAGFLTKDRVLAYDYFDKGNLAFAYEPEVNGIAFVERTGIALDQFGSDLTTWKKIRRMFPLVNIFNDALIQIEIGGSETPSGPVTYGAPVLFDPTTDYKVDGIKGGRYLAVRFTGTTADDFEIAGYDLDVSNGGRR